MPARIIETNTMPFAAPAIDPVTLDVKKQWTVGAYPDGLAFGDE